MCTDFLSSVGRDSFHTAGGNTLDIARAVQPVHGDLQQSADGASFNTVRTEFNNARAVTLVCSAVL